MSQQQEAERIIYHNGRTHAEHCAWLDALDGEEWLIVHMPPGHLMSLAFASNFKRALLTVEMSAGARLKFLDGMARMIYGPVTAEAIAAIEPACDTAAKMLREINSLPKEKVSYAFNQADLFSKLAKLNPSLITALERCNYGSKDKKAQMVAN